MKQYKEGDRVVCGKGIGTITEVDPDVSIPDIGEEWKHYIFVKWDGLDGEDPIGFDSLEEEDWLKII